MESFRLIHLADCSKRGDLIVLNIFQSTVKQIGKTFVMLSIVPDAPDGRISDLFLDLTVVHPLHGPNSRSKLPLHEAKKDRRATHKACYRRTKKYNALCEQNGLKFLLIFVESTGKMHPFLCDFFVIVMDTITKDTPTQYKHITMAVLLA